MKTIVITSQKGGSGKTTLAAHLAVEAERSGDGAAWLIDTDQQATLTTWHDRREAETPALFEVALPRLPQALAQMETEGAAYCFIDTAPAHSEQNKGVIQLADLVLIPVRPSPADLWAVSSTVELVKDAGKPLLFIRGELSDVLSGKTLDNMLKRVPGSEAVTVARVGHAPTLDEPEVQAAIDRLLAKVG